MVYCTFGRNRLRTRSPIGYRPKNSNRKIALKRLRAERRKIAGWVMHRHHSAALIASFARRRECCSPGSCVSTLRHPVPSHPIPPLHSTRPTGWLCLFEPQVIRQLMLQRSRFEFLVMALEVRFCRFYVRTASLIWLSSSSSSWRRWWLWLIMMMAIMMVMMTMPDDDDDDDDGGGGDSDGDNDGGGGDDDDDNHYDFNQYYNYCFILRWRAAAIATPTVCSAPWTPLSRTMPVHYKQELYPMVVFTKMGSFTSLDRNKGHAPIQPKNSGIVPGGEGTLMVRSTKRASCAALCCAALCCAVLCCSVICCVMLYCAVLYCAVLCCAVLCCAVLCCAVLFCAALCCTVLCCTALCCAALCCAVLCCAVLFCAALCCTVLCCTALCCAVLRLYGAALCCAALCCAVLCCSVLRYVVLCCSVLRYVVLCWAMLWAAMLWRGLLCLSVLCCAVLYCAMLCCAVL